MCRLRSDACAHAHTHQTMGYALSRPGTAAAGAGTEVVLGCSSHMANLEALTVEMEHDGGTCEAVAGSWKPACRGGAAAAAPAAAAKSRGTHFSKLWRFEAASGAGPLQIDGQGSTVRIRACGGGAAQRCLKSVSGCDIDACKGGAAVSLCHDCPRVVRSVTVEHAQAGSVEHAGGPGSADCTGAGTACAEKAQLEEHLAMCRELLEMEPGCKWALLTQMYLLALLHEAHEARDINDGAHDASLEALRETNVEIKRVGSELIAVDATRKSYYADVMSRADLRLACAMAARTTGPEAQVCGWSLISLSAPSLVRLIGIRVLDVSDNALTDLDGIEMLYGLEKLVADGCCLRSLAAVAALPSLLALSIRRNGIQRVAALLGPISHLPALASVDVAENAGALEAPERIANFHILR